MEIVHVDASNFEQEVLQSKIPVLVDFWAEWCGPCMMLGPIIEEVSEEVDDVKFCKVNCDKARDVALQFGIMTIPNLIVFENGEQVNQSIGYIEKEDVLKLIK